MLFGLLLSVASAQTPMLPPGFSMMQTQSADTRWLGADTPSKRFDDEDLAGPVFAKDEPVELIVTDGERARVRAGERYGWVPVATLTAVPPMAAAPALPVGGNPLLGGLPPLLPAPAPASP